MTSDLAVFQITSRAPQDFSAKIMQFVWHVKEVMGVSASDSEDGWHHPRPVGQYTKCAWDPVKRHNGKEVSVLIPAFKNRHRWINTGYYKRDMLRKMQRWNQSNLWRCIISRNSLSCISSMISSGTKLKYAATRTWLSCVREETQRNPLDSSPAHCTIYGDRGILLANGEAARIISWDYTINQYI